MSQYYITSIPLTSSQPNPLSTSINPQSTNSYRDSLYQKKTYVTEVPIITNSYHSKHKSLPLSLEDNTINHHIYTCDKGTTSKTLGYPLVKNPYKIRHKKSKKSFPIPFYSSSQRFLIDKSTGKENPGPGAYNLLTDPGVNINPSFSKKGYTIGFVSKDKRFDDRNFKLEKYKPGPGEYRCSFYNSLKYKVDNSLFGKRLFNDEYCLSLKEDDVFPDPCCYNPVKMENANAFLGVQNAFKSNSCRFKENEFENYVPGPGSYHCSLDILDGKNRFPSSIFIKEKAKKPDLLKKYKIKTNEEVNKDVLIDKFDKIKSEEANNSCFSIISNEEKINNSPNSYKKHHANVHEYIATNLYNSPTLLSKFNYIKTERDKVKDNIYINGKLNPTLEKDELNKIKNAQSYNFNFQPNEILRLSPPRWKKDKYKLVVPGPAYYNPKIINNKLSFNRNGKNIFLYSPGVCFK